MVFLHRAVFAAFALPGAALLLAGCGGGSGSSTSTARIRSVDAAVGTQTVDVIVNGGAVYGDQTFFNGVNNAPASPYEYIKPENGVSLSYLLTNQTLPNSAAASINAGNVSADNYYTAFLIGSFDASYVTPPADPRILQTVLLAPRAAPTTNLATVRVLDAAPDAGFTQTLVAGTTTDNAGTIDVTLGSPTATTFNNIAYGTASSYQTVTPGTNIPVTVTLTGSATGTVTTSTSTISVAAGQVYTLVLTETSSAPTYSLFLLSE